MDSHQKRSMQAYIAKIKKIADEAEKLHDSLDDEAYKPHLKEEINGYRQLIALWKQRLEKDT